MDESRNRRIDAIKMKRKADPMQLADLEMSLVQERALLNRARLIQMHLKDNPGWLALAEDLREELKDLEDRMDDFQNLTDKGRDYLLTNRKIVKEFLARVDTLDLIIEKTSERISELTATINEKRQRVRAAQPGV